MRCSKGCTREISVSAHAQNCMLEMGMSGCVEEVD